MEQNLNEKESLAIIATMIKSTRQKVGENGIFYLMWGWSVLAAALLHYYLLTTNYQYPWIGWMLMPITGIVSGIYGYRKNKSATVKTHLDTAMSYLWMAFVVVLLLVLFASPKIGFESTYPMVILLYGLGTFVSGGLLKFRPLIIGGILSWVCGMAAFYVSFDQQLLLLSAAIVVSYIVPGQLLYRKKND